MSTSKKSSYSHQWLDNYGKNNWDYWTTYIEDKNNTIWEATLNIAKTANGEKVLYDINPIKKVEASVKSLPTTNNSISDSSVIVNSEYENNSQPHSDRDPEAQAQLEKVTHGLQYLYIILPTDGHDINFIMTNEVIEELRVNDKINIIPSSVGLKILSKNNRSDKLSEYFIEEQKKESTAYYVSHSKEEGYLYSEIAPLIDGNGEIVAFLGADVSIQEMVETIIGYIVFLLFGILVFSSLFLWSLYRWIKKRITVPIQKMDESAKGFISKSHKDTDAEKLEFPSLDINTGDEIEELSNSLCKMSEDIKEYLTRIIIQTKEEEKILSELDVAKKIQEEMLPRKFPPFPEHNQFEILASISPAKQVGGDFYDFFFVDEKRLALVIADVSDKGVPAALFMAISKALIKNRALMGGSPSEIFSDVNSQLCEGNDSICSLT